MGFDTEVLVHGRLPLARSARCFTARHSTGPASSRASRCRSAPEAPRTDPRHGGIVRVHVLQHVPFEGPGSIAAWLEAQRAAVAYTRFYESTRLPSIGNLDLVIALGGPMSVNDDASLSWLADEKRFIREAIDRGLPVVGICLGAQLVASTLGARVRRAPRKEIGWFEVESCDAAGDCFRFPSRSTVFHWHGETFDLPRGAVRLARSEACENQAFQFGERVIGLQFHLETTAGSAEALIAHCGEELVEDEYVQSAAALRMVPAAAYARINALMVDVLAYVTRRSG